MEESRRCTARNLDEQEKEEDGEAQEEEHRVKQEEESMQKAGKSVLGQKRRESLTPRLSLDTHVMWGCSCVCMCGGTARPLGYSFAISCWICYKTFYDIAPRG